MQNKQTDAHEPHALSMTVYDLPDPAAAANEDAGRTTAGRLRMLLVLLICASPVLASYFTFYVLRPDSIKSFGELIMPVKSIPALQAQDLKGTAVSLQSLKGQWLLVSVAPAACDEACQQNLYLQRQIRATLGPEKERTDWVWLISDDTQVNQQVLPGLTEAVVLRVPESAIAQWLTPQTGHALQDHLYLVDPHGDWMMRFPAKLQSDQAPKLRRDWERLLRAAVSWDQPGR